MFDIRRDSDGTIHLIGRLDGSQADSAKKILETIKTSCSVDFSQLEYISSAGLGVLFATQKRLRDAGQQLKLINVSKHIKDVFKIARFDLIFEIH
jgi:anti-sigma B factor antagonist